MLIDTGENTLASWAKIIDCGDAPLTFLDNTVALQQLEKAHRVQHNRNVQQRSYATQVLSLNQVISGLNVSTPSKSSIPRIVMLGGDHTTTLAALRVAGSRHGTLSVIHFDSHIGLLAYRKRQHQDSRLSWTR